MRAQRLETMVTWYGEHVNVALHRGRFDPLERFVDVPAAGMDARDVDVGPDWVFEETAQRGFAARYRVTSTPDGSVDVFGGVRMLDLKSSFDWEFSVDAP